MMHSGGPKYNLTPCRSFGLQRTQKRTPNSKGLTPQGGTCGNLSTPFRSPLLADSPKSTPSVGKQSSTAKPSWSTPLLPKARVKMGLSKPSPKTDPLAKALTKGLIQTSVDKSERPRGVGNTPQKTLTGLPNRLNASILHRAQVTSIQEAKIDEICNTKVGNESDKTCAQRAEEQPHSPEKNPLVDELEPPVLSPQKPLGQVSFPPCAIREVRITGDSPPKLCGLGSSPQQKSNPSSQESFCGWDLEDQESLDSDSRRDSFRKCASKFPAGETVENYNADQQLGKSESKVSVPNKEFSRSRKLSFVREKFKSKRRLLSDSDNSDDDSDDDFSIQRKNSQESCTRSFTVHRGNKNQPKTRPEAFMSSDSEMDDVHCRRNVPKSRLLGPPLISEEAIVMDQESEKENQKDSSQNKSSRPLSKGKTKSRRRVLSDSDDDDDTSVPVKPNKQCGSESPYVVEEVTLDKDSMVGPKKSHSANSNAAVKTPPLKKSKLGEEIQIVQPNLDGDSIQEAPGSLSKRSVASVSASVERTNYQAQSSDSDDDSFVVRKNPVRTSQDEPVVPKVPSRKDSSKVKLVVALSRLPDSALPDVNEDMGGSERSSQSSCATDSSSEEMCSKLQNSLKTYGRVVPKRENVLKKHGRLSNSRHPLNKSASKLSSCLDESISLPPNILRDDDDDETIRRFAECIGEDRQILGQSMENEMQKWLVGGQQVISQIIEEVKIQRDKEMTVMEVLQEHNIDPNLVGYDPAVEEFVSFDKFLAKNNLA